jgi:hypothetical protein
LRQVIKWVILYQMATTLFDSHTFIKRLRATGFTEEQAEVIVESPAMPCRNW